MTSVEHWQMLVTAGAIIVAAFVVSSVAATAAPLDTPGMLPIYWKDIIKPGEWDIITCKVPKDGGE